MRSVLEKIINRRKIRTRPGLNYNLEKQNEPGKAVDLDASLVHMDTLEFCLVRENSKFIPVQISRKILKKKIYVCNF